MITRLLDYSNRKGKALACRLVQWTGKHPRPLHPKHLIPEGHQYMQWIKPSDHVIDVGCGSGAHALLAADRAQSVIGMDSALNLAADVTKDCPNVRLRYADLERGIPSDDALYDVALALDVIEHLENRQGLLREIHRVLVPNGILLITGPNRETAWRQRLRRAGLDARHDPDHKVEYLCLSEFLDELHRGGFVAQQWEPTVYDTPLAGLIDVVGGLSLPLYRRLAAWKRRRALEAPHEATGWLVVARRAQ